MGLINIYPRDGGRATQINPPHVPTSLTITSDEDGERIRINNGPGSQPLVIEVAADRIDFDGCTIWRWPTRQPVHFQPGQSMNGWANLGGKYVHPMGVA